MEEGDSFLLTSAKMKRDCGLQTFPPSRKGGDDRRVFVKLEGRGNEGESSDSDVISELTLNHKVSF